MGRSLNCATRIIRFVEQFRGLLKADGASLTTTFALTLVPLVGFVGAAVDYSRANAARTAMQAAVDSTALMLSKHAPTLTEAQLHTKAGEYFNAVFIRPDVTSVSTVTNYISSGGSQLFFKASASVKTEFMHIMGFNNFNISASSTVKWGNKRLRVALVLDTTGSMDNDGKMPALKTAAKDLLTQLQAAVNVNGDVYVSIMPFSKNVNVGSSNYNANWIDWTDWEAAPATAVSWIANNASAWERVGPGSNCPFTSGTHGFRCAPNPTSTLTTDKIPSNNNTIPSSGTYSGYICPSTTTQVNQGPQQYWHKVGIIYNGCYNSLLKPDSEWHPVRTGSSASCGSLPSSQCQCTGSGSSKVCVMRPESNWQPIATGSSMSCGNLPSSQCECFNSGSNKFCKQKTYNHTWIKNNRNTWNGCVTDRGTSSGPSQDYDRKATEPSASNASKFPAEQNAYCSPEVIALNYNWSSMKTEIDNLYPLGATNQPIGLVWGWQSLVGGGPFPAPPPKDSNYTYNEVIVLMSDGLNTLNRWNGNGSDTSTTVDARMHESDTIGTCANVKAAGITIYAIHVNTDGSPTSTLLKNCASSADKFWVVTTASGIASVFNQIGTALSQLRLAL